MYILIFFHTNMIKKRLLSFMITFPLSNASHYICEFLGVLILGIYFSISYWLIQDKPVGLTMKPKRPCFLDIIGNVKGLSFYDAK